MPRAANRQTAIAKLHGRIFFPNDKHHDFISFINDPVFILGRSDPSQIPDNPLVPAQKGVAIGLGDSNKLSRHHAQIRYDKANAVFQLVCLGKNGLTATQHDQTVVMTPETSPVILQNRALIQMGDAIFCFLLPSEYPAPVPKKRDWIKAETAALRTLMMRLGYGRWKDIISLASGRLSERQPEELVPVARSFVARCYIHARPGVEQKVLGEILREDAPSPDLASEDVIEADVEALVKEAKDAAEPNEKRKFVRWARKLRLLRRLRDVHDHSSLERLRAGELRVFTPRPTPFWTDADDVDLIIGSYKHGYGSAENIRSDPELGFRDRYRPVPTNRKRSGPKSKTPSATNGDDDDDHEEDDDSGDDEDNANSNGASTATPKKEPKKIKNGPTSAREGGSESGDHIEESDSAPSVKGEDIPAEVEPMNVDKKEPEEEEEAAKVETAKEDGDTMEGVEPANGAAAKASDEIVDVTPVPDEKMLFPTSEALMKRLKSVINACAKEYERDVREKRKAAQAQNRAQQRKQDLEQRKKEKEKEKQRIREERKMARSQPFSKKDAVEFEKALANFGLELKEDETHDWERFIAKCPTFQNKYAETLEAAYEGFKKEAHRLIDCSAAKDDEDMERLDELQKQPPSSVFTQVTLERAEKVLERLSFFRTLRGEVLKNPAMSTILRGCKRTKELPLWWRSTHDKALLWAVDKHGMNSWDKVVNDDTLPFAESMREHEDKYADQEKPLKKGAFPKASAAVKRAISLVQYFKSKYTDPIFSQEYSKAKKEEHKVSGNGGSSLHGDEDEDDALMKEEDDVGMNENGNGHSNCNSNSHNNAGHGEEVKMEFAQEEEEESKVALNLLDSKGKLILPAVISNDLFLLELGDIMDGPEWHTETDLYPAGYRSVRTIDSDAYLCEIRKSEVPMQHMNVNMHMSNVNMVITAPMFRVSLLKGFQTQDYSKPMWESSHIVIENPDPAALILADPTNGYQFSVGTVQFGLRTPTVVHYMQQLPGVERCVRYRMKEVGTAANKANKNSNRNKKKKEAGIKEALLKGLKRHNDELSASPNNNGNAANTNGNNNNTNTNNYNTMEEEEHEMKLEDDMKEIYGKKRRRKGEPAWRQEADLHQPRNDLHELQHQPRNDLRELQHQQ